MGVFTGADYAKTGEIVKDKHTCYFRGGSDLIE